MAVKIVRVLFILSCIIMGAIWAMYISGEEADSPLTWRWTYVGALAGTFSAIIVMFLMQFITQEIFERISPALVAVVLGLVTGFTLGQWILDMYLPDADSNFKIFVVCSLMLVFGFVGISLGLTRASNWEALVKAVHRQEYMGSSLKIIDTSVIIDGRITDIVATGFIEGVFLIPRVVLKELQNIADSSDVLRRARGRRGLDILKELQQPGSNVTIKVIEDDPVDVAEVDGKLVRLAKIYKASIMTNDLNLNKVAQIDGVNVLNINDLANALKPAVLPDEEMHVRIIKEGKEAFQGVGYLDDGTMVVVDGGKNHVGSDVSIIVTSVLQTSAGRMIFSKLQSVLS